jgi:hypothetical protein
LRRIDLVVLVGHNWYNDDAVNASRNRTAEVRAVMRMPRLAPLVPPTAVAAMTEKISIAMTRTPVSFQPDRVVCAGLLLDADGVSPALEELTDTSFVSSRCMGRLQLVVRCRGSRGRADDIWNSIGKNGDSALELG